MTDQTFSILSSAELATTGGGFGVKHGVAGGVVTGLGTSYAINKTLAEGHTCLGGFLDTRSTAGRALRSFGACKDD